MDDQTDRIGVFDDLSDFEYHGGPGYSKSGLDLIRKSPAHFKASKEYAERIPTPDMRIGSLTHTLCLEPGEFENEYAELFEPPEIALSKKEHYVARLKDLGLKTTGTNPDLINASAPPKRAADPRNRQRVR